MTNECEKLGDNLIKNSHAKGGDITMTTTTNEDKENLQNDLNKKVNEIYGVFNYHDLMKEIKAYEDRRMSSSLGLEDSATISIKFDSNVYNRPNTDIINIQLKIKEIL
jgi:hypothetical protein